MRPKKGRPKLHNFSSEEFQKLSTEERQLRGRISTLRRMIKKRESDIDELKPSIMKEVNKLMKPIHKGKGKFKSVWKRLNRLLRTSMTTTMSFHHFELKDIR